MATTFDLNVIFRAIDKMSVPMAQMQKKLNDFSDKASKIGKSMQNVGKGMMKYVTAPIMALSGIGVAQFAQQEEAIFRLQNAIKLTGREGEISVDSLLKLSDELQNVTKFSDDASLSALALVQQMGNLSETQLKESLPAMQDFASMMGIDLQSAATLFGKSLSTGNNYLQRYGINFKETGNKAEFFKNMLEAVNKKAKGTSQEAAKGLSGALFQLKNNFFEISEVIGEVLAPMIIKVSNAFRRFRIWFTNLNPSMKKFIVTTMLITAAIGPLIFVIGKLISVVGMVGKAFSILRMLLTPQGLIIMAIVAAIIIIILVIRNWSKIVLFLKKVWQGFIVILKKAGDFFVSLGKTIFKTALKFAEIITIINPFIGIPLLIIKYWKPLTEFFTGVWDGIVGVFRWAWKYIEPIIKGITTFVSDNPLFKAMFGENKKINNTANNVKEKSQTDVNIKVSADNGAVATVQGVKKKGKTKTKVYTSNELGYSHP